MIIFICGYAGSGKDTLCRDIIAEDLSRWMIASDDFSIPDLDHKFTRYSFADRLKEDVELLYGIPNEDKDKDVPKYYYGGKLVSARDVWIDVATYNRNRDPDYYTKHIEDYEKDMIVTDWRYPNELEYHKDKTDVITIRVFRHEVRRLNIPSETALDDFKTDYLFIDNYDSFYKCKSMLPQYKDFKIVI